MPLPKLREELVLMPGPRLADGQPSWTLHDPTRNRFFSIDWLTFEILRRWDFDDPESIAVAVSHDSTLKIDQHDVDRVARFLVEDQLVRAQPGDAARFAERLGRARSQGLKWLLHHYLFFRVPLVKPDAWLSRWLPLARQCRSRLFILLSLLALVFGSGQVVRQWDTFIASMVDTFSWQGLASYGVALCAVKILHELGHAFAAKGFGCRVPTMGVAFLVLWPMAYTDTNDAWRLTSRWQRLLVASSGILTELTVAAWALLAWAMLPDGALRSAAFVLATTSWITTLAINTSPFMRFDGYFILSDWLSMPNLHERSFALARWKLREWLFDLGEPKPEYFAPAKEAGLIAFAWLTWLYRLMVFLGIAVLVYHFFVKAIGVMLFAVEIFWFVLMPIRNEIRAWRTRWPIIRKNARSRRSLLMVLGMLLLAAVPWPDRVTASGQLRPAQSWPLFAPEAAQVTALPVAEGAAVAEGALLIALESPTLQARREGLLAQIRRLRWQAAAAGLDEQSRAVLQSSQQELATAEAELAGLDEQLARFSPRAPFAGRLRDLDPDLQPGQWLAVDEPIGMLIGPGGSLVETYLDEDSVKRVEPGDRAIFVSDGGEGPVLELEVESIDADATRLLDSGLLSAESGGHILARRISGHRVPEVGVYRVALRVVTPLGNLEGRSWRGHVSIHGEWQSPIARYARQALAVLVREATL